MEAVNAKGERLQWNGKAWVPQSRPGEPFDFSAKQMITNIPDSALKFGKDMVEPLIHPVRTATAIKNIAQGIVAKAMPGHQEQEVYADALGKYFVDRYGSVDNFSRSLQNDPIGVLGDVSSVLTMGGAALAKAPATAGKIGAGLERIGLTINPANAAFQGIAKGVSSIPGIQGAAEKMYSSATKMTGSLSGNPLKVAADRTRNVRTALREKIIPNDAGVGKIQRLVGELNGQIDDIISAADQAGTRIKAADVLAELQNARAAADVVGDPGSIKAVAKIDQTIKRFEQSLKGAETMTVRQAQEAKKAIGARLNWNAKAGSTTFEAQAADQAIRQATRKAIEQVDPRIAALNAREGDLLNLRDPLAKAANRIAGRDQLGLGVTVPAGAGAVIGGPAGTVLGTAIGLVQDPRIQSRIALQLQRLIDAGMRPEMAARLVPVLAAQGANEAGRAQAEQSFQSAPAAAQFAR